MKRNTLRFFFTLCGIGMSKVWQSAGGIANGKVLRAKAIKNYYDNPNYCKRCRSLINVEGKQKIQSVRKKKFCNRSCAASLNNSLKPKRLKIYKKREIKKSAFERFVASRSRLRNITKGELLKRHGSWQGYRSTIQKDARKVFTIYGKRECNVCKYEKHVEIAHVKSVSSFPNSATINEINDPSNLVALCPNHHWEFDNLLLDDKATIP